MNVTLDTANHAVRIVDEITVLRVTIYLETQSRLRIKIEDANDSQRFQVPISTPTVANAAGLTDYVVNTTSNPFGIVVKRKATNTVIFNSAFGPLIYANQFLQVALILICLS